MARLTPSRRTVYAGLEVGADQPPRRTFGGIGRDAMGAQLLCKTAAPLAQCGLADIESLAVLRDCLDHGVYVRMALVRMQRQGISMFQCELLAQEDAAGGHQLLRISSPRHGEHNVVHELSGAPARFTSVRRLAKC